MVRASTMQQKVEEATYDSIFTIANEIDLEVPCLPEVYWVGRKLKFEDLGLPESHRYSFEQVKKTRRSRSCSNPAYIFIGAYKKYHIAHEATHYNHFVNSKIKLNNKKPNYDFLGSHIISEMIAFFGSKLIEPNIKNAYNQFSDSLTHADKCAKEISEYNLNPTRFFIHQQGYKLGEELYNYYISKRISKEKIRKFCKRSFNKKDEAITTFLALKGDFINQFG